MTRAASKSVLVTGASSGIGRATALRLAAEGMQVFAACRKASDGEALASEAKPGTLTPVLMDVTSADSIAACRERIAAAADGGLDGLVNNAGVGTSGPMEALPLDTVRAAFEVNLFGQLAVIQAFLPLLHPRRGRIVNLGSVGARITIPFGGVLCGSKAAFESFSDALRLELHPLGLHVSIIRPGSIHTPAVAKTLGGVDEAIAGWPEAARTRYGAMFRSFTARAVAREEAGSPPEVVAEAILHALTAATPRTRYAVGKDARALSLLPRLLPDGLLDRIRLKMLGLPTAFGPAARSGEEETAASGGAAMGR
ncbi:SDR family oxidoreductase [Chelatococcus sp. GCM10030263]|uniref:SDR family oxidoreductase n=1 Tax=Chelatococcus sp. GCM10030263 TaxID=3273387 RepID=UPI00360C4817